MEKKIISYVKLIKIMQKMIIRLHRCSEFFFLDLNTLNKPRDEYNSKEKNSSYLKLNLIV